jgi:hypothetical protein
MSYNLVIWKGPATADADRTWARLRDNEPVDGLEPLERDVVFQAFESVFDNDVERQESGSMAGPDFDVLVADNRPYAQICCAWSVLETERGARVLGEILQVADRLGARVFDPQTSSPPADPTIRAIRAALERLGTATVEEHAKPDEDRAQSFARVDRWRVAGYDNITDSLHALYLREAGAGTSSRHAYHPSRLADVTCDYVRLVQTVFPFEIVVASGGGRAGDGTACTFGTRVMGIVDGIAGFIGSPRNTLEEEDGVAFGRWTGVEFCTTGPLASRRGSTTDLSEVVARAAVGALAAAHEGRTRPLRDWLVLMASLDAGGLAAEELFAPEVPEANVVARAFEGNESGAVMPIWTQRANGSSRVEARLRLPDAARFELKLVTLDRSAPQRHRLAPPLGPGAT